MRPTLARLLIPILSLALLPPRALADVIHLRNGGTIVADSWEERDDHLIVHQGGGSLRVPRSEVLSIDPSPQASPAPAAAPSPSPAPAADKAPPTDQEILAAIDELKRRLNGYPLARAQNTSRLTSLLGELGWRALKARDYDSALARFREALGYDPRDAGAQLGLATTYFRTDQDIFARSTLERALLDHPDNAALHGLLGEVYYGQERTEEALAEWKKSYELKPDPTLKARIDKLVRERSIDAGYRQSEGAHFTLKYDGERAGPDLSGEILSYLEGQFRSLENQFDHYPLQPIVVILYPQRQFYEATRAESNVAGLFDGKIRVPIGGLKQLDAQARHVLVHELAHAFIAGKSGGTCPRWLHEGLAQVQEGRTTSTATGTALAKEFEGLASKDSWGESFSYPSALSFAEYLDERLGFPTLVDVLGTMAKGGTADAAFEEVTRYSLKELRQAWGETLVRKYLQ